MRFALVLSDSLEQQRAAVRSFREDFHLLLQMKDRALGDDRLMEVLRHAATMIAMVQKMFDAPTHDELIEQELDPLMREALLAVDSEEATKKAFQRVDIKRKYGVKRLREVVERNRASPMRSTPP